MTKEITISFIIFGMVCFTLGLISSGKGSQSDKLTAILGIVTLITGIGCIVVCVIWKFWFGIFLLLLIFYIMINIGSSIMKRALSNRYFPRAKNKTTMNRRPFIYVRPSLFIKSFKKSKIMKKIERLKMMKLNIHSFEDFSQYTKRHEKLSDCYSQLFACMQEMDGYREILAYYQTSAAELNEISDRIALTGYDYYRQYYIPVALVSLGKPLAYILENKHIILERGTSEIIELIENAVCLI